MAATPSCLRPRAERPGLFNALNARSETTSAFHGLFANRWLWGSLLLGVVLQVAVVEFGFLQVAFGTDSLDLAHWAVCSGLASVVLWYDELRKVILRRTIPSQSPRSRSRSQITLG